MPIPIRAAVNNRLIDEVNRYSDKQNKVIDNNTNVASYFHAVKKDHDLVKIQKIITEKINGIETLEGKIEEYKNIKIQLDDIQRRVSNNEEYKENLEKNNKKFIKHAENICYHTNTIPVILTKYFGIVIKTSVANLLSTWIDEQVNLLIKTTSNALISELKTILLNTTNNDQFPIEQQIVRNMTALKIAMDILNLNKRQIISALPYNSDDSIATKNENADNLFKEKIANGSYKNLPDTQYDLKTVIYIHDILKEYDKSNSNYSYIIQNMHLQLIKKMNSWVKNISKITSYENKLNIGTKTIQHSKTTWNEYTQTATAVINNNVIDDDFDRLTATYIVDGISYPNTQLAFNLTQNDNVKRMIKFSSYQTLPLLFHVTGGYHKQPNTDELTVIINSKTMQISYIQKYNINPTNTAENMKIANDKETENKKASKYRLVSKHTFKINKDKISWINLNNQQKTNLPNTKYPTLKECVSDFKIDYFEILDNKIKHNQRSNLLFNNNSETIKEQTTVLLNIIEKYKDTPDFLDELFIAIFNHLTIDNYQGNNRLLTQLEYLKTQPEKNEENCFDTYIRINNALKLVCANNSQYFAQDIPRSAAKILYRVCLAIQGSYFETENDELNKLKSRPQTYVEKFLEKLADSKSNYEYLALKFNPRSFNFDINDINLKLTSNNNAVEDIDEAEFTWLQNNDNVNDSKSEVNRPLADPNRLNKIEADEIAQFNMQPFCSTISETGKDYTSYKLENNYKLEIYKTITDKSDINNILGIMTYEKKKLALIPYVITDRGLLHDNHMVLILVYEGKVCVYDSKALSKNYQITKVPHMAVSTNWQALTDGNNCGYYSIHLLSEIASKFIHAAKTGYVDMSAICTEIQNQVTNIREIKAKYDNIRKYNQDLEICRTKLNITQEHAPSHTKRTNEDIKNDITTLKQKINEYTTSQKDAIKETINTTDFLAITEFQRKLMDINNHNSSQHWDISEEYNTIQENIINVLRSNNMTRFLQIFEKIMQQSSECSTNEKKYILDILEKRSNALKLELTPQERCDVLLKIQYVIHEADSVITSKNNKQNILDYIKQNIITTQEHNNEMFTMSNYMQSTLIDEKRMEAIKQKLKKHINSTKFNSSDINAIKVAINKVIKSTAVDKIKKSDIIKNITGTQSDAIERIFAQFLKLTGDKQNLVVGDGDGSPARFFLAALLGGFISFNNTTEGMQDLCFLMAQEAITIDLENGKHAKYEWFKAFQQSEEVQNKCISLLNNIKFHKSDKSLSFIGDNLFDRLLNNGYVTYYLLANLYINGCVLIRGNHDLFKMSMSMTINNNEQFGKNALNKADTLNWQIFIDNCFKTCHSQNGHLLVHNGVAPIYTNNITEPVALSSLIENLFTTAGCKEYMEQILIPQNQGHLDLESTYIVTAAGVVKFYDDMSVEELVKKINNLTPQVSIEAVSDFRPKDDIFKQSDQEAIQKFVQWCDKNKVKIVHGHDGNYSADNKNLVINVNSSVEGCGRRPTIYAFNNPT